eukprot:TRINITY_DN90172_c0_g1_i1.p1 TRINITY_DN90172_c0_g1~~TRINITY_DN90172_c0_g1_i1.p1  ORF type:complete len:480 (+),score=67.36 TRINITY_DN90172_c0_g1_i1:181-1620(+)
MLPIPQKARTAAATQKADEETPADVGGAAMMQQIVEVDESAFSRSMSPVESQASMGKSPSVKSSMSKSPSVKSYAEMSREAEEVKTKWRAQDPGRYVLMAGVVLAGCAGFVNATALLTCGAFVSHVTGTTAKLGLALEGYYTDGMEARLVFQALLLVVSFLVGAIICGLLVSRNDVHFGKSAYGVALCLNSFLLIGAIFAFDVVAASDLPGYFDGKWLALYLQSAACGLQNGMCTAHFGAVVRTTHLTGLMTDSGLTIGRLASILLRTRCRRRNFEPLDFAEVYVDLKKLVVFTSLLTGYILGICGGASLSEPLGIHALFVPAGVTGLGGLAYIVAKARCWAAFERAEADKLSLHLEQAEEIFTRAKSQLQDWCPDSPRSCKEFEQLDTEVGKALNLLHDMEARLQHKISKSSSGGSGGRPLSPSRKSDGQTDSARRIHSAPSLLTSLSLNFGHASVQQTQLADGRGSRNDANTGSILL